MPKKVLLVKFLIIYTLKRITPTRISKTPENFKKFFITDYFSFLLNLQTAKDFSNYFHNKNLKSYFERSHFINNFLFINLNFIFVL